MKIRATDPHPDLMFKSGINGATSLSIMRRLTDSRFATRWFRGVGVDVGGAPDPLGLYVELFPLIEKVIIYDRDQGDAQTMENVDDCEFDFLFSSHCLEHMVDPYEALRNWVRVVKPGGHLVIDVPDEDLYEQGHWPSKHNPAHVTSWTIHKESSWSLDSVNVLDLVRSVESLIRPLKIELIDHGYRYALRECGVDHTRTPVAECSIEIVLQRLP